MSQLSFDDAPPGDSLYVIGEGGACGVVKIGRAIDPAKRLPSLQTGNPRRLFLLHVESGGGALERDVHAWLDDWRLEGEWFDLGDSDPVAEVQRVIGLIRSAVSRPRRLRPEPAPEPAPPGPDDMLTAAEAAWELSMETGEIAEWRASGSGPDWQFADGGIRYRRGDLADWIERMLAEQRAA